MGAALSSNIFHWHKDSSGKYEVNKIIDVESIDNKILPVPMPGLITDILVSMDDKYLYFSNWLHGDLRQYDISDPFNPKLTGQVWIGGLLGKADKINGRLVNGAPQMIQLSLTTGKDFLLPLNYFHHYSICPKMNDSKYDAN